MKKGDKIKKDISWVSFKQTGTAWSRKVVYEQMKEAIGTVVYVHPKGRFYCLEFQFSGGVYRECFV